MNYLYSKLDYDATFHTNTPERRAFKEHLVKVAKALHDIEWVDSGDYRTGDENAAIRACLSSEQLLESVIEQAKEALTNLREELVRVKA
jgi:hypothetical protein